MLATNVANDLFQARGDAIQLAEARETYRIAQNLATPPTSRRLTG